MSVTNFGRYWGYFEYAPALRYQYPLSIIALIAAFSLFFASCAGRPAPAAAVENDNGLTDDSIPASRLNGSWILQDDDGKVLWEMTLDNGSFEDYHPPVRLSFSKGTYTVSGNIITFTVTRFYARFFGRLPYTELYSKEEVLSAAKAGVEMEENYEALFANVFTSYTGEYFPADDIWVTEKGSDGYKTYRRGRLMERLPFDGFER